MSAIVLPGDCRKIIAGLADQSIDAIVTDPPYELGFMGKRWDASGIAYDVDLWAECLRVLKPGGHLLAFGGTRTYHRMTVAIEDAGFEIRDSIHWLYGSGFPKSLDVSKAIDKRGGVMPWQADFARHLRAVKPADVTTAQINAHVANGTKSNFWGHFIDTTSQPLLPTVEQYRRLREIVPIDPEWDALFLPEAEREVVGTKTSGIANKDEGPRHTIGASQAVTVDVTAPATDAARQWEGWGTALKPAHEPIVVARKPLAGTVAANVMEHGTGALNIDGCRVGVTDADYARNCSGDRGHEGTRGADQEGATNIHAGGGSAAAGRWPANLAIDDVIAGRHPEWGHYFYTAKPSRRERNAGLDGLPKGSTDFGGNGRPGAGFNEVTHGKAPSPAQNIHPTVKPLALMRWLVRLVTPPGGTVLDPFAGSGTTLAAAILEGFDAIGCEMTEDYLPIIDGRIAWAEAERAKTTPTLFGDAA